MAAIALLDTLATNIFRGGRGFEKESGSESLVKILNGVIGKVNTALGSINAGTLDTLSVDPSSYAGTYGSGQESWLVVDGTNPPTLAAFRILDRDTSTYVTATYDSSISATDLQFA